VSEGVVDAELAALLWLLVEGVPLVVGGEPDALRMEVAAAVLAIDPARPWVVIDADARPPSLESLAALLRGGSWVGISMAGSDLAEVVARLKAPPIDLPDDAVRRLGAVIVVAHRAPGPRVVAAHYLRPTERDAGGHLQRRPPAVLATWDAGQDAFEHYAWGVTPELGDRVGRAQADLEERQRDRAAFITRMAADAPLAPGEQARRVRAYLATEPPRVAPEAPRAAEPSPFRGGLLDREPHVH